MEKTGQAVQEKIVYLNVADVHPSNNYRKTMDKGKFEELKASIKERGVQTPIWVRENGKGYLIIAGSRRHQACVELKIETIPAIVKEVSSDQDALILSCIENDQREDVSPMEQAEAYQNALNKGSHTPETLAEKLGKKLPYVLGRLKLLKISKKAQKALRDGEIEYGHALLISRLKDHRDQDEFLNGIFTEEWNRKLTVKEAEEYLDNYSMRLASAPFDVKTICANCPSRSRTQAVLFPDAAKKDDECMNKACFQQKTREHYEKQAKDLEAKGIKVLTTAKAVQAAKAGGLVISPDPQDHNHPKKYKSMCAAPCENRAVYIYTDPNSHARTVETGEICLDKKCFNTMNGKKEVSGRGSFGMPARKGPTNAAVQHATFMRDRFLRSRLPAKFEASETLRMRLAIYHILCRFEQFGGQGRTDLKMDHHQSFKALMKDLCPAWKPEQYGRLDDQKLYSAVSSIPGKQLGGVFKRVVLASVPHTDEEVLLQATPEAGIILEKDFLVDETYLNTLTKAELEKFAKTVNPKDMFGRGMKKTGIIKAILEYDNLTGKVPPLVTKECKVISLGAAKAKKRQK